jgi:hypothetical protein
MKNVVQIVAGAMIIIMIGMNLDKMENFITSSYGGPLAPVKSETTQAKSVDIVDNRKTDIPSSISMMPISCLPSDQAESILIAQGLAILATGAVIDKGQGDELVEVWMHPQDKWFVILRLIPSKSSSCIMSKGPLLIPGGTLFNQELVL